MYNLCRLKTVAAVATFVVASVTATTAASANPFNPFETLFGPHREPVTARAYPNPAKVVVLPMNGRRASTDASSVN